MCKFIGVEILAANALIDILEAGKGRSVTLDELKNYGIEIVDILEKNFKERAVILYDRDRMINLVIDYGDYFELDGNTLKVKSNVSSEQLRDRFRGPLSYEILSAIITNRKNLLSNLIIR